VTARSCDSLLTLSRLSRPDSSKAAAKAFLLARAGPRLASHGCPLGCAFSSHDRGSRKLAAYQRKAAQSQLISVNLHVHGRARLSPCINLVADSSPQRPDSRQSIACATNTCLLPQPNMVTAAGERGKKLCHVLLARSLLPCLLLSFVLLPCLLLSSVLAALSLPCRLAYTACLSLPFCL
jgi:hypothetical protein